MDATWDNDHLGMATKVAVERFAMNSVAGHFAPPTVVDKKLTQVPANRFDYGQQVVVDNENLNLFEPFATCNFTLSQVTEFGSAKDEAAMQSRVLTAITRAASSLARWHDVLFFFGLEDDQNGKLAKLPLGVSPGPLRKAGDPNVPRGLRQVAIAAEQELAVGPILVGSGGADLNEDLVKTVYKAVLGLEAQGYYTNYHLILGEKLWEELHRPTAGSLVLPRDRIEPTLLGATFIARRPCRTMRRCLHLWMDRRSTVSLPRNRTSILCSRFCQRKSRTKQCTRLESSNASRLGSGSIGRSYASKSITRGSPDSQHGSRPWPQGFYPSE